MHFFDDIYLSTLGEHYIDSEGHEETDMLARLVGRQPIGLGLGRGHSCALCWNLYVNENMPVFSKMVDYVTVRFQVCVVAISRICHYSVVTTTKGIN